MNVQQYILINVVLIAVFCVVCLLLNRKSTQEKKPPLCDTCNNLEQKRRYSIFRYRYICGSYSTFSDLKKFDRCPKQCSHYRPNNTK